MIAVVKFHGNKHIWLPTLSFFLPRLTLNRVENEKAELLNELKLFRMQGNKPSSDLMVSIVFTAIIQKIYFRQNTAIWTQPMWTHNLTPAQDLGSYALDQSCLIRTIDPIANIKRARQESIVHLHGSQAQFCYARLGLSCLKFIFFNSRLDFLLFVDPTQQSQSILSFSPL